MPLTLLSLLYKVRGVTDVSRALEQLDEIHGRLARAEVYRGWRSVPSIRFEGFNNP